VDLSASIPAWWAGAVRDQKGAYRGGWRANLQGFLGTSRRELISLTFMLASRTTHGRVFFPNWIVNNPGKTVCFQNDI